MSDDKPTPAQERSRILAVIVARDALLRERKDWERRASEWESAADDRTLVATERAEKAEAERDEARAELDEERACHDCREYRALLDRRITKEPK